MNFPKNYCKGYIVGHRQTLWAIKNSSNIQLNRDEKSLSDSELVSTLNTFFTSVNADILSLARSISVTSILSKILEDFVVYCMLKDISDIIDPRQFGSGAQQPIVCWT